MVASTAVLRIASERRQPLSVSVWAKADGHLGLHAEAEEGVAVGLVHVHAREAAAEEALRVRVEQGEGLEVE